MTTPAEWDRSYAQMERTDFVSIPRYDLSVLTIPVSDLEDRRTPEEISSLTAKLFYSTRYYGAYDLDAGEFTGAHPGIDLKLALGTPIGAVGGGIVRYAGNSGLLGLHVIIEHRMPDGSAYYSIYGHFGSISVHEGDTVRSGQTLGAVGMTGSTSGPHLHLQIDRGEPGEVHVPYTTTSVPSREAVRRWTVNPITFIRG
jgi:murein DD-endopeptidase MepM/ murein hydrolase activator NlpD